MARSLCRYCPVFKRFIDEPSRGICTSTRGRRREVSEDDICHYIFNHRWICKAQPLNLNLETQVTKK